MYVACIWWICFFYILALKLRHIIEPHTHTHTTCSQTHLHFLSQLCRYSYTSLCIYVMCVYIIYIFCDDKTANFFVFFAASFILYLISLSYTLSIYQFICLCVWVHVRVSRSLHLTFTLFVYLLKRQPVLRCLRKAYQYYIICYILSRFEVRFVCAIHVKAFSMRFVCLLHVVIISKQLLLLFLILRICVVDSV